MNLKLDKFPEIYKLYFEKFYEYQCKYGKCTAVFMEVGSFYEMYEIEPIEFIKVTKHENSIIEKLTGNATIVSNLIGITVTSKDNKKPHSFQNPKMSGFPNAVLDKYISKLVKLSYTIVVINQYDSENTLKGKTRKVENIYSPGTYIDHSLDIGSSSSSNYIVCIHIDHYKPLKSKLKTIHEQYQNKTNVHITAVDLSTGVTKAYNTFDTNNNNCLNDVYRYIHSMNPSEIIITIRESENNLVDTKFYKKFIDFLQIEKMIHYINVPKEYYNPVYQNEFFSRIYGEKFSNFKGSVNNYIEYLGFSFHPELVISYMVLLQFAYEHDNLIVKMLKVPEISIDTNVLILNNDSVYQLNLINNVYNNDSCSLLNLLDKTCTLMGKRLLKERLLRPITDTIELNRRYDLIEKAIEFKIPDSINVVLKGIPDLEKLHRKIKLRKLSPNEFYKMFSSYTFCIKVLETGLKLYNLPENMNMLKKTISNFDTFISRILEQFNLEHFTSYDKMTNSGFSNKNIGYISSLFKLGRYTEIDEFFNKIQFIQETFKKLGDKLIEFIGKPDSVKLMFNDRDGFFYSTTKIRSKLIQNSLENYNDPQMGVEENIIDLFVGLEFSTKTSSVDISSPKIRKMSHELSKLQEQVFELIREKYLDTLESIYIEYDETIENVLHFISEIDIVNCSCLNVIGHSYFRPKIVNDLNNSESFIKIKSIRHPIVERILNTKYELNDIEISSKNPMLLYGINSSGKSTLIRAIGCNLVMAQAGLFTAGKMEYYPYHTLISKISCTDNLYKGMSTFITEMYEIKNMKELSNVHTLVLADELCAGTEHNSATSIVASMIHLLKQNKASFLFSTHLHSLVDLPIIKKLVENNELSINHFSTNDFQKESESDSELFGKMLDTRVSFCRTLKSGPGSTLYGLEIAKTFDLGNEFMKTAYKVRNELLNQSNQIFNTKSSRYNSNVFIDSCEKCGKSSNFNTFSESSTGASTGGSTGGSTGISANLLHTHHIIEQHTADPYGMVELTPDLKIHKNHPQNLMVLCETCHRDIHHK